MIGRATNVLLVGGYPPPYGGVSTQIATLRRRLSETPGYAGRVLDTGPSRRIRRPGCLPARSALEFVEQLCGRAMRRDIIHLHMPGHNLESWVIIFACACAGLLGGRRTMVSICSGAAPEFISAARGPVRLLMRLGLGLMGAVVCGNERTRRALVDVGSRPDKVMIHSGFYGVPTDGLPEIPPKIGAFLRQQYPVVAALAGPGPEYGIPLLLQAVARLQSRYPRLGLILIGGGHVETPPGDGRILWTGELMHDLALSVMRRVTVFVRPTYFDGDALSVREALALGVPVVASDTDFRPQGAILFRRGDVEDLTERLVQALSHPPSRGGLPQVADADALAQLLVLYRRFGHARGGTQIGSDTPIVGAKPWQ